MSDPQTARDIARLRSDPGYIALMDLLADWLRAVEDRMAAEENPEKALEILRRWQIGRLFYLTLLHTPEKFSENWEE